MIDLTTRSTCLPQWPHRLIAMAVLAVAASTSGCSVVERFKPCSCNCGSDGCAAGIAGGVTAMPYAMDSSLPTPYPQPLPVVNMSPNSAASPSSHTEGWAPRHDVLAQAASATHEKQLLEARNDFDDKLASLESRFEDEHRASGAMNDQLQVLHGDVVRLSKDVEYWENEVRRIDRTAEMHHRSDMANLHSISQLIDQIAPRSASGELAPGSENQ